MSNDYMDGRRRPAPEGRGADRPGNGGPAGRGELNRDGRNTGGQGRFSRNAGGQDRDGQNVGGRDWDSQNAGGQDWNGQNAGGQDWDSRHMDGQDWDSQNAGGQDWNGQDQDEWGWDGRNTEDPDWDSQDIDDQAWDSQNQDEWGWDSLDPDSQGREEWNWDDQDQAGYDGGAGDRSGRNQAGHDRSAGGRNGQVRDNRERNARGRDSQTGGVRVPGAYGQAAAAGSRLRQSREAGGQDGRNRAAENQNYRNREDGSRNYRNRAAGNPDIENRSQGLRNQNHGGQNTQMGDDLMENDRIRTAARRGETPAGTSERERNPRQAGGQPGRGAAGGDGVRRQASRPEPEQQAHRSPRPASKRRTYSPKTDPQSAENESFSNKVAQLRAETTRKKRRRRRIIAMIIAECLVLSCIFSYAYVSRMWNLMPRPSVDKENVQNPNIPVETFTKMKGYWMVAVFGLDSGTSDNVSRGNRSDVNIIACVNQDTGEIKLVSLYRDTYMKIGDNDYRKFNMAYSKGGPEQALKMLNENLDLNITEYITFNWKAVADGINILGGVDVDITSSEFKFINAFITETVNETGVPSFQLKSAGMNHLDGVQAVAYGRLRLMDNDYKRTERQRKIIELAVQKAKQADYALLNNILVVCLEQVMTNLDFVDLTNAALNASKYYISDTAGFPFDIGEANLGGNKGACVIPKSLESNVSKLHQFLFGDEAYEPTEAVKKISQKIASDTGMYASQAKSGSSSGSSQKSTKAASSSEEKSTKAETEAQTKETTETDESTKETDENGVIIGPPGIGETDENGELVDPPEPDDPDDPWYQNGPGEGRPGESSQALYPGYEGNENNGSGQTSGGPVTRPGESTGASVPGSNTNPSQSSTGPGNTGSAVPGSTSPGGTSAGPGAQTPGGNTGSSSGGPGSGSTGPGTQTPGGNTGSSVGPGSSSGGSGSGSAGPGAQTPGGNTGGSAGPGSGTDNGTILGPGSSLGGPGSGSAGPG